MSSIFHRRSTRIYLDKPVEEEKILDILKAGMQAPSAENQQPWEFYVVTDKDKLREMSKIHQWSGMVAKAPVCILPCYRKNLPAHDLAVQDMGACLENMWIRVDELGLGAVWCAIAPYEHIIENARKVLDIPDTLVPFCLFPIGYPTEEWTQEDRFDESRIHFVK